MGGGTSKRPQVRLEDDRKWDDVVAPVGPGTMKVVPFDHFRTLKSIPSFKNAEPIELSSIDRNKGLIIFVSHPFRCEASQTREDPTSEDTPRLVAYLKGAMKFNKPDTVDNDKFNLIVTGIERLLLNHIPPGVKVFLWIDHCCIDFDDPSEVAASKKGLDHYIHMSDCLFTPIIDPEWSKWVRPKVLINFFEDYQAAMWKSYLERAWCRTEAFLGAYISCVDSDKFESYTGPFKHFGTVLKLRPHLIFGTREMMLRDSPVFLPPLRSENFAQYHPCEGRVHLEADRSYIAEHVKNYRLHVARLDHDSFCCYKGSWKDGKRDGHGSITFREGHCYEGMWSEDCRHGQGILFYACGDVYSGGWVANLRSGTGTHWYCNGDRYDGSFCGGNKNGKGTLTYADGAEYKGDFKEGLSHGYGVHTYPCGSSYSGQHRMGKRNGKGKFKFANGDVYQGEWCNGRMHGIGVYFYQELERRYEGGWRHDLKHGHGIMVEKGVQVYSGPWRFGQIDDTEIQEMVL